MRENTIPLMVWLFVALLLGLSGCGDGGSSGTAGTAGDSKISQKVVSSNAATSPVQLPRTGQTACYNAVGAVTECSGVSGQDGELLAGVAWPNPRFIVNGDTVTDNLTRLSWTRDGNLMKTSDPTFDADSTVGDGAVSWQHALDYVKKLNTENYLGHNDWRLPNRNELESLVNKGQANSATWLNEQGFSNIQAGKYWSSSTYAFSTANAWSVNMSFGDVNYAGKTINYFYVWPVRSEMSGTISTSTLSKTGQTTCYNASNTAVVCSGTTGQDGELMTGVAWPSPRFSDNGDKTVTDNLTGLNWTRDGNPAAVAYTWQQALNYINTLNSENYLGNNDWRLPNRNELESLVNKGQSNSAAYLNGQGFSNVQAKYYWSSSTYVGGIVNNAWGVGMDSGYVNYELKDKSFYVWPVRTGLSNAVSSLTLTNAKVFLGAGGDNFTVSNSGATLYGNMGINTVTIASGATGVILDQNIERINLSGTSSNYTFKQTGNMINVYDHSGLLLIVRAPVQGDYDGTVLSFGNGIAFTSALLTTGGVMTLGGQPVSTTTPTALTPATTTSTLSTATNTIAKVFLSAGGDNFTVSNSGTTTLYGNIGIDSVTIAAGASNVTLDQNIEQINFTGASSSYAFKQTGNIINVYYAADITTLLVRAPVQGDTDGTQILFSNVTASAKLAGGVMTLDGKPLSSGTPSVLP